jgi:hypothetical protein
MAWSSRFLITLGNFFNHPATNHLQFGGIDSTDQSEIKFVGKETGQEVVGALDPTFLFKLIERKENFSARSITLAFDSPSSLKPRSLSSKWMARK